MLAEFTFVYMRHAASICLVSTSKFDLRELKNKVSLPINTMAHAMRRFPDSEIVYMQNPRIPYKIKFTRGYSIISLFINIGIFMSDICVVWILV